MTRKVFALFFGILFLVPVVGRALETHRYFQETGAKHVTSNWILKKKTENRLALTSVRGNEISECLLNLEFDTLKWRLDRPGTDTRVTAARTVEGILIKGRHEGKGINKMIEIDDRPWYQATSLSLRRLVQSEDSSVQFWIMRLDNLATYSVRATKGDHEVITVRGKAYGTQKIRLTLTGFLSLFGSSTYWFRLRDGVLVRYEGPSGPPGAPRTVIEIIPEDGN